MKLDHTGPVQISAHLTEILPGVANWLLQKGVLQVTVAFFTSSQYSPLVNSLFDHVFISNTILR